MITVAFPPVIFVKLVEDSSTALNNTKYGIFIFKKEE